MIRSGVMFNQVIQLLNWLMVQPPPLDIIKGNRQEMKTFQTKTCLLFVRLKPTWLQITRIIIWGSNCCHAAGMFDQLPNIFQLDQLVSNGAANPG